MLYHVHTAVNTARGIDWDARAFEAEQQEQAVVSEKMGKSFFFSCTAFIFVSKLLQSQYVFIF